ncbi:MAG: cyclic nucleotide-binding/CBS domain-containing protein [Acidobacteriota bacterium]
MDEHYINEVNEEYLAGVSGRDAWPISEAIFERPVSDLKKRPWLAVPSATTVKDAAKQMVAKGIGSCLATHDGRLAGILTERDLVNQMVNNPFDPNETPVEQIMHTKVVTVMPDATVAYAIHRMSSGGYRHLPIIDRENRPVGVVSVRDIADYLAVLFPHKILNQPPDPTKIPATREGG